MPGHWRDAASASVTSFALVNGETGDLTATPAEFSVRSCPSRSPGPSATTDAYWVEDANGRRFGFVYFRDRAVIGTGGETFQTRDEARRLVSNFAKLPDLLLRTAESQSGGKPAR